MPVFYAYDGAALYFHSARAGTKIEIMKRNPRLCFCLSLDHDIVAGDQTCDFEAQHRTVIGLGRAVFVEDEAARVAALERIVVRFTAQKFDYPKTNLAQTAVIRIDIESLKGKKHGFA